MNLQFLLQNVLSAPTRDTSKVVNKYLVLPPEGTGIGDSQTEFKEGGGAQSPRS
jgi:hypothetical protein